MGESTVIGIHVAGGTLRRAELAHRDQKIEVIQLEALPRPLTLSSAPTAPGDAGEIKLSLNGSRLVASLPAIDVMSRCWPLPATGAGKMRQLVSNRLEADLPVPLDKMIWGYRQAQAATSGSRATCTILAQAARSDRVQQYLASLAALGINVNLLTTEAEALTGLYRHALQPSSDGQDVIVFAGAEEWLVCAFVHGLAQVVRRIRLQPGQVESACRECRQMMATQFNPGSLKRIGWCTAEPSDQAAATLQQICEVPVQPVQVVERLLKRSGQPLNAEELVKFGPAIGLALAAMFDKEAVIRFAGAETKEETAARRPIDRVLARPWACVGVAAGLFLLAAGVHIGAIQWETRRMNAAVGSATASAAIRSLQPQIVAKNRLEKFRIDVEGICGEIAAAVKDPITLTSIQLSREHRLVIKGTAKDNPTAIFTFADDLRKSSRFKTVNPERASPGQGGDFVITADLIGVEKFSTPGLRGAP